MSQSRLDQLPVEILQRIAALGPCESALALLKVNRALYGACNHRIVFQEIIRNGNGSKSDLPIWKTCRLDASLPVELWARYALADSKAAQQPLAITWKELTSEWSKRTSSWGPHLVLLGHPWVKNPGALDHTAWRMPYRSRFYEPWVWHLASFYWATYLLSEEDPLALSRAGNISDNCSPGVLRQPLDMSFPDRAIEPSFSDSCLTLQHGNALRAVGILVGAIQALYAVAPRQRQSRLLPPRLDSIPLLEVINPPHPFTRNVPQWTIQNHLRKMTSKEFLKDGEWEGYYCYSLGGFGPDFDEPMRGIRFQVYAQSSDNVSVRLHAVGGHDQFGSFELDGMITVNNGKISMTKTYSHGTTWEWSALMTPFGIVGSWGGHPWGGWLWIWKASWSDERGAE